MDENLLQFTLTAFVTLIVVVDPLGVAPEFVALTSELATAERNKVLRRATIVAFDISLFFLLADRWLLSYLGVMVHAFAISGGILLFVAAWPMLFGHQGTGIRSNQNLRAELLRQLSHFCLIAATLRTDRKYTHPWASHVRETKSCSVSYFPDFVWKIASHWLCMEPLVEA